MERDFAIDRKIDKFKLDSEAEHNAVIIDYYGNEYARARSDMNAKDTFLDTLYAKKGLYYQKNPIDGLKTTDTSIKNMVDSDEEIVQAKMELDKAKEKFYFMEVAYETVKERSTQIGNLTKLWLGGYFSTQPNVTENKGDSLRENLNVS